MKLTADKIKDAIRKKGIDKVRQIIYGKQCQYEYIGMGKFIDSRPSWCSKEIMSQLKESEV